MKQLLTLGAILIWCMFLYAYSQWISHKDLKSCEIIYKVSMNKGTNNNYDDIMNPERYNIKTNTWGGYSEKNIL